MAEKVAKVGVKKAAGWLYFVDKDGHIARAPMKHGSKAKGRKQVLTKETIKREPGYLYYVDKQGYIARSKMARGRKAKKGKK